MPLADEAVETNEKAEEGEDVWPEDVCIGRRRLQFSALRFESNLCVDGDCDTEDKWFAEWEARGKKRKKQVKWSSLNAKGKHQLELVKLGEMALVEKKKKYLSQKVSLSKLSLKTLSQNLSQPHSAHMLTLALCSSHMPTR